MPQQLASFPGLKTGRGYSAVVLDHSLARLAFSYVLGLLSLCSAVSTAARSTVTFDSTFLFEAPPLFARVTSRTQLCHIDDRPLKLHFENFNIDYPLDLLCCEKYKCIFKFSQHDYRYSTNTKFTVQRTNAYTHTYIHTEVWEVPEKHY